MTQPANLDLLGETAPHTSVTKQHARPAVDAIFRAIVSAADLFPRKLSKRCARSAAPPLRMQSPTKSRKAGFAYSRTSGLA